MTIRYGGAEADSWEEIQKGIDSGIIQKHDTIAVSADVQPAHGLWHDQNLGGLFANAGAETDVFHTVVRPDTGFMNSLMIGTNPFRNPEYDVLSGVRALSGDPAVDACSVAPIAGEAKLCTLTSRFGEVNVMTEKADLTKMGGRINRADVDRRLVNSFVFNSPFLPDVVTQWNINTTTGLTLFRTAIAIERDMLWGLFNGNNGTADRIFTDEFDGFDQILIENPTDVLGNVCAAASATVVAWGDSDVTATVGDADIVQTIAGITKKLQSLANTTSLGATWTLVMDDDLFYRITEIWPCSYLTDGCAVQTTSQPLNIDSARQIQMRDEMRTGSFLLVNGQRWPVVTVDGELIGRTAVGAGFSSTIYIIPMTAMGRKVTFIEGFDLGSADGAAWRSLGGSEGGVDVTNGGLYMITSLRSHACMEWKFHMQPRLVCRTPWLGARITGVNYNLPDFAWNRSAYPGTQYFANGGQYFTTGNI